ncbi:hypothetical protein Rhal01_03836 [Rubritalea halochordaticola]|uniref:Lipocalin-like domain-containing protein n=1 Tax=Rubritalea halochordaticola TaxID=714537 RepID=A0ABP9V4T5_9BACT
MKIIPLILSALVSLSGLLVSCDRATESEVAQQSRQEEDPHSVSSMVGTWTLYPFTSEASAMGKITIGNDGAYTITTNKRTETGTLSKRPCDKETLAEIGMDRENLTGMITFKTEEKSIEGVWFYDEDSIVIERGAIKDGFINDEGELVVFHDELILFRLTRDTREGVTPKPSSPK